MKRKIRGAAQSFIIALVIVTVAIVAAIALEDPAAKRYWRALATPVVPAVNVLASFFIGGAHGMSLSRNQALAATFGIALVMWWVILEACRSVWWLVRRTRHAQPD
jgi:hypothetical protein